MSDGRIRIWPAIKRGRIAPELHGLQLEMAGQCVYDGIWVGRTSRIPNEDGIRLDVLALLKHLRAPVLKWPGEDFAAHYHWRDGVGTGEPRPVRLNPMGQQLEPNTFGTHEFMLLCEKVGCTPWLTCNGVTGTAQEALDWVEYCTFGGDTTLADKRIRNGAPDPFDVPYWSSGAASESSSLRLINPEIHEITGRTLSPQSATSNTIQAFPFLLDVKDESRGTMAAFSRRCAAFGRFLGALDHAALPARPPVALVPWGVVHPGATAESGLDQPCTLEDALYAAASMHFFHDHADRIRLAALAQAVNGHACLIKTRGADLILTPIYHAMDLLQPHKGALALYREVECPSLALADGTALPALSVSASRVKKRLSVTVVHLGGDEPQPLAIEMREASIGTVTGRLLQSTSARAENTFESPKAVGVSRITPTIEDNVFRCELPPHSMACFSVALK